MSSSKEISSNNSLKSNFVYNALGIISNFLFPLITFPYVSRILMADGIGLVQFYTSIINYVVLLTSIGIPMYGIREVARVRDNIEELSKTVTEIILLNLFLNVIGYIAIFILSITVIEINANFYLFLILSASIILTTIGCPWFYSGIEDFKYITIRGLIVKIICVFLLFILVKTEKDILYYGIYVILGTLGNNILNFIRLKRYIVFETKDLHPFRHLKPALAIFIFNIITSIYLNLDTVMLGFLRNSASVGYYTAAIKLSHIGLSITTSLGTVMLPRLSNLVKKGEWSTFNRLSEKSYNFLTMISFPMCLGFIIMAPILIHLFSGSNFEPAIKTLQIISPIIIALGISNLIGMQILYPLGKIKLVTISTCIGALVNFTLNLMLIPTLAQNGAAIATVVAEISVTVTQCIIARKYIPFNLINKGLLQCLIASLVMLIVCFFILRKDLPEYVCLFAIPIVGGISYVTVLLLVKNKMMWDMIGTVKASIYRK
jgi:hypothetical protein